MSGLHNLSNRPYALLEFRRIVKKEGLLLFVEPGVINPTTMIGRRFFPTDIHTQNEKPFHSKTITKEFLSVSFSIKISEHTTSFSILF